MQLAVLKERSKYIYKWGSILACAAKYNPFASLYFGMECEEISADAPASLLVNSIVNFSDMSP